MVANRNVEAIIEGAQRMAVNGEITCEDAHVLAAQLGVQPLDVGRAVNSRSDLRFNRCQLGLFGYGAKSEGKSKIVLEAAHIPPEIETALTQRVSDGAISCLAVWEVAEQFRYPRLGMANIVQALGLKVAPCQLGCF